MFEPQKVKRLTVQKAEDPRCHEPHGSQSPQVLGYKKMPCQAYPIIKKINWEDASDLLGIAIFR